MNTMRHNQIRVLHALTLGALIPASVTAQRVSLAPTVGVYFPTTELLNGTPGEAPKQELSIAVGGELGIGFSQRVRFEGTGTYVPSDLTFSLGDPSAPRQDANLFLGSGRLVVDVLPPARTLSLQLSGGLGVVNRNGAAYAEQEDRTDLGGTFGARVGVRLGQILWLQFGANNFVYSPQFVAAASRKTQNDGHLSFGVGIPILGLSTSTGNAAN